MKKLGLVLVMVFAVSIAFAQFDNRATVNQNSTYAGNWYSVKQQTGGINFVAINQVSWQNNEATVNQAGSKNDLEVNQTGNRETGTIWSDQQGLRNKALLDQNTGFGANAKISQYGNDNILVGVDEYGSILPYNFAVQTGGGNVTASPEIKLVLVQSGGSNNTAGMYQGGTVYENANIKQTGDWNTVASYQKTTNGYNDLDVTQTGLDKATGIQKGAGNNYGYINQ